MVSEVGWWLLVSLYLPANRRPSSWWVWKWLVWKMGVGGMYVLEWGWVGTYIHTYIHRHIDTWMHTAFAGRGRVLCSYIKVTKLVIDLKWFLGSWKSMINWRGGSLPRWGWSWIRHRQLNYPRPHQAGKSSQVLSWLIVTLPGRGARVVESEEWSARTIRRFDSPTGGSMTLVSILFSPSSRESSGDSYRLSHTLTCCSWMIVHQSTV